MGAITHCLVDVQPVPTWAIIIGTLSLPCLFIGPSFQYAKFYRTGSVEGVSALTLAIGSMARGLVVVNLFILHYDQMEICYNTNNPPSFLECQVCVPVELYHIFQNTPHFLNLQHLGQANPPNPKQILTLLWYPTKKGKPSMTVSVCLENKGYYAYCTDSLPIAPKTLPLKLTNWFCFYPADSETKRKMLVNHKHIPARVLACTPEKVDGAAILVMQFDVEWW